MVNQRNISEIGAAEIVVKSISQYRYDMDKNRIAEISKLKFFPTSEGLKESTGISGLGDMSKDFVSHVTNNTDKADLKVFLSKLNIGFDDTEISCGAALKLRSSTGSSMNQMALTEENVFKTMPAIQKWRSSENNALEYLKCFKGVLSASDVSTANMGYDLEVILVSGKKLFIEVKSVTNFDEPFKITNNEYSSAHNFGDSYFIALVINAEPFQMKFIPNPIKTLVFEKQIERWSWLCSRYDDHLLGSSAILH